MPSPSPHTPPKAPLIIIFTIIAQKTVVDESKPVFWCNVFKRVNESRKTLKQPQQIRVKGRMELTLTLIYQGGGSNLTPQREIGQNRQENGNFDGPDPQKNIRQKKYTTYDIRIDIRTTYVSTRHTTRLDIRLDSTYDSTRHMIRLDTGIQLQFRKFQDFLKFKISDDISRFFLIFCLDLFKHKIV